MDVVARCVTAETLNVPAQPTADRQVDAQPALAAPPVGSLWRRTWWRVVLVPLTVLAPLVALAPTRDHRFNIYWHGAMFRDNPLEIVPHTIRSLPGYLGVGNFRPLGRMLEKALDLAAYALTDVLGLPINVTFRLVSFLSAIVLCAVAVLFAESLVSRGRLFRQAPSRLAATVPFAVGAGFVAAGPASPVILFGGLYLLSGALVLGVAAAACRVGADRTRLGWWRIALLLPAGAALACFNEIAYLALPFATAAVLLRGTLVLGLGRRRVLTNLPARVLGALWLGFLPVFIAVRAIIYGYCADGDCYNNSDINLGPDVLTAGPVRMIAWFPPLMWRTAASDGGWSWLSGVIPVLALVVLAVLARLAVRDLSRLSTVDRRQAAGLAAAAFTLLVLGATLAALNGQVQSIVAAGHWGQGWRDTSVTAAAGALLLVALGHLLSARRTVAVALVLVFALAAVGSAAANKRYADRISVTGPDLLANRLALEMADFDRSSAGDVRRCRLRDEFRVRAVGSVYSLAHFDESFELAAREIAGTPFCSAAPR
jgi:hypothetical protein